ncbi:MAG TPA: hypothetical protein VF485_15680 [Sphingomonas sp.]
MSDIPSPAPIAEYQAVDREQFDRDIRPVEQPAILRGVLGDLDDDKLAWVRATLRDSLSRKA